MAASSRPRATTRGARVPSADAGGASTDGTKLCFTKARSGGRARPFMRSRWAAEMKMYAETSSRHAARCTVVDATTDNVAVREPR